MKIIVNGRMREVTANRLSALLEELDMTGDHIATAVNGIFIARDKRATLRLVEGDCVEVITPRQGG